MKQVTIYLAREITLARKGAESLKLPAGRNTVDDDVAKHPFVKAHCLDASAMADAAKADAKLAARVAELEKANAAQAGQIAELEKANVEGSARVAELEKENADLKNDLAAKTAELEAMVAAMEKATAPGGKK